MRGLSTVRLPALLVALLATACTRTAEEGRLVGTLERDRIELVAEVSEPIATVLVSEGVAVTAGHELLRLDDERSRAEVGQARALLERLQARLAELERGPRQELIAEAEAQLAGAEGTLAAAERELTRARSLLRRGIAPTAQLDQAQAAYDQALAQRDRGRASLSALRTGSTREELEQARAAVAEASAAVAAAELRQRRLVITAPVDGEVDALPFEVGERPPPGAAVVVLLAAQAPYARVYVPETVRSRVRPGTAARVHVDGEPRPFAARVRSVAADAAFTPHFALTERDRGRLSYLAEVELTDPEARRLPSGLPLEVQLDLAAR